MRLSLVLWCRFIGIRRPRRRWLCCVAVREEVYYSSAGVLEASYELAAGGPVFALNIPAGQWHTLRALESGTVILEMKDGAYEPIGVEDVMER